ncbi:MAG: SDR family NAD(P)-dependent oxidoreductase [Clostridia bacterium]|nr:SDR family NAD(P)-dependent oxidoreductase [Clostridia bacterium]
MKIALVTGASSGLGQKYAEYIGEIFPEIEEIWALARREIRLKALAEKITVPKIVPIECDLTKDSDIEKLRQRIRAKSPEILLLINNAGCGFHGAFEASSEEEQLRSIALNVTALTQITRMALDYMPEGARILNTSSIASFVPNAYMSVYSATKAYVTFFSRGLNEELKKSGRSVTAVCPAPMNTEFLTVGHIQGNSKTFERLPYCDVGKVARAALIKAKKRKSVYTPRAFYKFYRILVRILPDWLLVKMAKT